MTLMEKEIDLLESTIPALASSALKQAYLHALASGCSVVEARDGQLLETGADGLVTVLKPLPVGKRVTLGKYRIRQ